MLPSAVVPAPNRDFVGGAVDAEHHILRGGCVTTDAHITGQHAGFETQHINHPGCAIRLANHILTITATKEVGVALQATGQRVIACAAAEGVCTCPAIEVVIAIAALQRVVAGQTEDRVITPRAVDVVIHTLKPDEAVIACTADVLRRVEFGGVPLGAVGKFNTFDALRSAGVPAAHGDLVGGAVDAEHQVVRAGQVTAHAHIAGRHARLETQHINHAGCAVRINDHVLTITATEEVGVALQAAGQDVIASAAIEGVTAIATQQGVVAGQTGDRVIPRHAVDDVIHPIGASERVLVCGAGVLRRVDFGSVPLGAIGKFNTFDALRSAGVPPRHRDFVRGAVNAEHHVVRAGQVTAHAHIAGCHTRLETQHIDHPGRGIRLTDHVLAITATKEVHIAMRAAGQRVIAGAAIEGVTAITPQQGVVAGQTGNRVVTRRAVDGVIHPIEPGEFVIARRADVLRGVEFGRIPFGAVGELRRFDSLRC